MKPITEWMEDGEDFEWSDMLADLQSFLNKFNPKGGYHAEVRNFGWNNRSGYHDFNTINAQTFLSNILPNTDCHFRIFKDKNAIKIQNFHHDSPMGNEWYTITKNNRRI